MNIPLLLILTSVSALAAIFAGKIATRYESLSMAIAAVVLGMTGLYTSILILLQVIQ